MTSRSEMLRAAAARLGAAGVPGALRDARKLLDHVAREASEDAELPQPVLEAFEALLVRRCTREPMSHLLGRRDFWQHSFEVTADVLDPRPETETLVEAALERPFETVLDLGTGSGAIVLSLLGARSEATGVATDISEGALAVARRNAARLEMSSRVRLLRSDWFVHVAGRFDLIVSNPPYIALDEMPALAPELGFEPRLALTDGADGLTGYRILAAGARDHLEPGGRILVEIGPTQRETVMGFFTAAGLVDVAVRRDLDGRDRVVIGHAP